MSLPVLSTAVNPSTSTSSARPASLHPARPSIGQPVRASGDDAWFDLGCGERSTRLPLEVSTALDSMLGPREWCRLASTGYKNCCAIASINNSSSVADGHTSDEDAVAQRSRWADLIEERLTEDSYQSLFSNDADVIIDKLTLNEVLVTLRSDRSTDAAPLYAMTVVLQLNIFVIAAHRTVSGRDQHVELPANDPMVAGSVMAYSERETRRLERARQQYERQINGAPPPTPENEAASTPSTMVQIKCLLMGPRVHAEWNSILLYHIIRQDNTWRRRLSQDRQEWACVASNTPGGHYESLVFPSNAIEHGEWSHAPSPAQSGVHHELVAGLTKWAMSGKAQVAREGPSSTPMSSTISRSTAATLTTAASDPTASGTAAGGPSASSTAAAPSSLVCIEVHREALDRLRREKCDVERRAAELEQQLQRAREEINRLRHPPQPTPRLSFPTRSISNSSVASSIPTPTSASFSVLISPSSMLLAQQASTPRTLRPRTPKTPATASQYYDQEGLRAMTE